MERPSATESSPLTVRPMRATQDDLEAFRRCLEANGLPRTREQVRWQFVENPIGSVLVDFAVDPRPEGETIAAIYAVVPVTARIDSQECVAAQSLDTLTDARYRGRGLFVTLAKATYARLAKEGVAFVYGFPNANSVHGFFQRLEWRSLDPLPWRIRPLRPGYLLRRLRIPSRVAARFDGARLPSAARSPAARLQHPRGPRVRCELRCALGALRGRDARRPAARCRVSALAPAPAGRTLSRLGARRRPGPPGLRRHEPGELRTSDCRLRDGVDLRTRGQGGRRRAAGARAARAGAGRRGSRSRLQLPPTHRITRRSGDWASFRCPGECAPRRSTSACVPSPPRRATRSSTGRAGI